MEQQMINQHRIIQLRQHRNWSQDQLATVAGLSLRTIQRFGGQRFGGSGDSDLIWVRGTVTLSHAGSQQWFGGQ